MLPNHDFFAGNGEVRSLLRMHEWPDSLLGPPEGWPIPLRTMVGMMLDSSLPMYVAWGPELALIYNDAYAQILGEKHPGALIKPFWEVWPEVIKEVGPVIERALAGISTFSTDVEMQLLRYGRPEQTWFTFSVSPIRDESGIVAGVFTTCMETSKQVLWERGQVAETQRLHQLFEQAPGFMAVLRGPEHVFELVNNAYLQFAGHRNFIGQSVKEAIPEVEGQGFIELLDGVYATGVPYIGRGVPLSLQVEPDSQPVERFADFVYQPIKNADGNISGIFVEGSDVTEQHHVQQELKRLNRDLAEKVQRLEEVKRRQVFRIELTDLLRSLSDPAEIFSRTSTLIGQYLSVCRVLYGEYDVANQKVTYHSNYTDGSVSELVGVYPTASFGPDNFASLEQGTTWVCGDLARDARTAGPDTWPTFEALDIYSGAVIPIHRDGTLIAALFINHNKPRAWAEEELRLIEDAVEHIWNAIERMRAEIALRQSAQRKDEFLAMLAHELHNPLAPISAAAELMGMVKLNEAALKQTSEIITRQVRHMTGLVDDLLDVSRVTRGLVSIDKSPQDMKTIVSNAVEQVRPIIETRRHHLKLHLPPESVQVAGDPKRLVQILTNLLNNAAKYTPEGGNILLETEADDGRVLITVRDDGIGIASELQPRVFELFAQAERTSDRSQGGLGLGLALVKSLTELHGGKVTCFSEGIGKGSRFTVCLPRLVEPGKASDRRKRARGIATPVEALRLLVVDDNTDAARMLAMFLEASGHHVLVEHGSHRALERARIEPPDVCLLDIGLPDMDGNELARRLRAQPETSGAVLIAVTGYGQEHDRESALAAGFDHHLVKPVDTATLTALIARIGMS
jgi:signal transduction histidine kinase/CheY-like chemotaxis protein/PAS domain-containing protein